MIELTITPKINQHTNKTWWFVEWDKAHGVAPGKEVNLLKIIYDEMSYTGTVGFCIEYPKDIKDHFDYHVMFVDDIYYQGMLREEDTVYIQRKNYEHIVGMVFKDRESAELFKYKIEVRWTFRALQKDYT